MSTIKSSDEHLTLNADGTSKDIKFQANGVEKASISSSGAFTSTTIDATKLTGDLPAISAASLTNVPAANITGTLPAIDGSNLTGVGVSGITSSADATAITIDSAENVGFGVTPTSFYSGYTGVQVGGNGTIYGQTAAGASNNFWVGQNVRAGTDGSEKAITTGNASQMLLTGGGGEFKVTTASANADANVTWSTAFHILPYDSAPNMYRGTQIVTDSNRSYIGTFRQTTGTTSHMNFFNTNGNIGSIKTNGTSTSFNTSSDYRLKENVDYTWDATTRLKQLKPARFNFIADEDNTLVDGFLAHEVENIVPEAISGTKDATETLSNAVVMPNGISVGSGITEEEWTTGKANGTYSADTIWKASHTQDVNQSIDQSKLVPLLVKTIQELEARITALEA